MPLKNPENYPLLTYGWMIALACWGGLTRYILRVRETNNRWSWKEALMQLVVSGFAGMLTSLICWHIQAPISLAGFLTGIAGAMGSAAINVFSSRFNALTGGQ
jgi:hypothetical protein